MPAEQKRAAAGAAGAAKKKARAAAPKKNDPAAKLCENVAAAIETAPDLSDSCRGMLKAMISLSIGTAKDNRHAHQETAATMIMEVLHGIESRLGGQVSDLQGQLDGAEGEKAGLESAQQEAEERVGAKLEEAEGLQGAKGERSKERAEAEATLGKAQQAQAAAAKEVAGADGERTKCMGVSTDHLAKVVAGQWETPAEIKAHVTALLGLGRSLKLDESLLSGMPAAAEKRPDERGPFDGMLLQQYEGQVQQRIASLDTLLKDGEAIAAAKAAEVQEAEAALAAARAAEQEAMEALEKAETEVQELGEAARAAKKAVKDFGPRLRKAAAARRAAEAELERFRADCLFDPFAPAPVEEEAPQDEAAAEAAPAPAPVEAVAAASAEKVAAAAEATVPAAHPVAAGA